MKIAIIFLILISLAVTAFSQGSYQNQSVRDAIAKYPALSDKESTLYQLAHKLAMEAKDPSSPNHVMFADPNGPMFFADLAAKQMGVSPVAVQTVDPERSALMARPPPLHHRYTDQDVENLYLSICNKMHRDNGYWPTNEEVVAELQKQLVPPEDAPLGPVDLKMLHLRQSP